MRKEEETRYRFGTLSSDLLLSASQECFNSPYGTQYFADYAEPIPGTSTELLASIAKECKVYLIGGEIGLYLSTVSFPRHFIGSDRIEGNSELHKDGQSSEIHPRMSWKLDPQYTEPVLLVPRFHSRTGW